MNKGSSEKSNFESKGRKRKGGQGGAVLILKASAGCISTWKWLLLGSTVYLRTKQGELELVPKPAAAFYEAKYVLSGTPRWEAVKPSDVSLPVQGPSVMESRHHL